MSDNVKLQWDKSMDDMIDHVEAMSDPINFRETRELELGLELAFSQSQSQTHVISGSLKSSGRSSSDIINGSAWEGIIEYGGDGQPHFVDYAIYEQARGGDHDFMRGLAEILDTAMENAIRLHWRE